jgi:energy-coupling factor transporter transmembrane protein EcfT
MKTDHTGNEKRHEAQKTMAILALACVLVGLLSGTKPFFYAALVLLAIEVFVEKWSLRISSLWLKFAHVLGVINTHIILFFVFYVFLTPLSLFYRMAHGDSLHLKREEQVKTYFSGRGQTYTARDLANPW